jgi:hypothetical protein
MKRPEDLAARVHVKRSYNKKEFIDLMLQRGTTTTRTDLVAVLNNIEETLAYITRDGGTVHLPVMSTGFGLAGLFEGATDSYDPARHELHVTLQPGPVLRAAARAAKLEKVNVTTPHPLILEVRDSVTGKADTVLTPGGVVEVHGTNVKIAGNATTCALWFLRDEDGTRSPAVTLVTNKPSTVIALIPTSLLPGHYRVMITTRFNGSGREWTEPRSTTFDKVLQVGG